ncbi:MAG: TadE family protein [Blastocatellia bacterium]|nr:TadE family protein [Blastocatellia bacterium]
MRASLHRQPGKDRRVRRRGEQGQSLLEFALIVPVLFLMLVGVAYIAQGFNLQMVLYGAAYEGARVWAKNPAGGDNIHCSPPACDPDAGTSRNFQKYVAPVVRQYVTNNGYNGALVYFFAKDQRQSDRSLDLVGNNPQSVSITLLYPIQLPVGNFAGSFQEVLVTATCTMKRGG